MDWKLAAQTYGSTTAKLRVMSDEEYRAYAEKWTERAITGMEKEHGLSKVKWIGFWDALHDERDRRAGGTADTDPWLGEVLKYLYEEREHAQVPTGQA